jgi:ABC-type uncharacterized transport system substrate-binding protein
MKRRDFLGVLGGAAAWWPLEAHAQQQAIPILGFMSFAPREATLQASWYQAFHDGMRDLGWVASRNLAIEYRFADNNADRLAALAHELVRLKPDAIFVPTRPALPTVRKATTTIPVVFVSLGDPVAEGWVASLAKPGGNLTGVAGLSPDLAGKRLELLRELTPSLSNVAVLWNPANSAEATAVKTTEAAAQKIGMSVVVERVSNRSGNRSYHAEWSKVYRRATRPDVPSEPHALSRINQAIAASGNLHGDRLCGSRRSHKLRTEFH